MKKIFILFICSIFCLSVLAEHVPFEEARIIADNWTNHLGNDFNDYVILLDGETIVRQGIEVAHVFHFFPRGYVIISAQDYLPPIKMYSLKNDFGKEGEQLEKLVFAQYREIIDKVNTSIIVPEKVFMAKNKKDFQRLKNISFPFRDLDTGMETVTAEVSPLLTTTWRQWEPYNLLCPFVDGERCVTGCVATGYAQIMKYYEYPSSGQGSKSYWTQKHNIYVSISFDHPYYWDQMLDAYPTPDTGTEEQRQAVAQLMFDVGAAVEMDYAPDGSGANPALAVWNFPRHFRYSMDTTYLNRRGWNDTEWFDLAKDQVDHGLPLAFAVYSKEAAHLLVVDGYRISNGSNTLHLNMGWGGNWDGYYALDNIIVQDGKYEFTELDYQSYVLNIVPPFLESNLPSLPFGATAHENWSLFLKEYFCQLTWKGLPLEEENPDKVDKYIVRKYDAYTGEMSVLAEMEHTGQAEYQCTFRMPEYKPDLYLVYTVRESGVWQMLLACHLDLKQ